MNKKENITGGGFAEAGEKKPCGGFAGMEEKKPCGSGSGGYRNRLWEKLKAGEKIYGFSVNFPSPPMIECLAPGWDYVWLDGQHGLMGYQELLSLSIAARAAQVSTIIRAPGHDFSVLGPLMDLCPQGLMAPMVNNGEEAKEIASCLQFPPKGRRSFWNTRMIQLAGDAYYKEKTTLVIAQIETAEGVRNVDGIIGTEGIDVLMYGPADLGLSYGLKPGSSRKEYPCMAHAAREVVRAARSAGKYSMFIAGDVREARELEEMGADIIVCGSDYGFLKEGAKEILDGLRGEALRQETGAKLSW